MKYFNIVILAIFLTVCVSIAQAKTQPTKKVAVFPVIFTESDKGDRVMDYDKEPCEKTNNIVDRSIELVGMEQISRSRLLSVWQRDMEEEYTEKLEELPSKSKLLDLGERLGVDYLIASKVHWRVRSLWVGLGLKTKANCTVDLFVIDVKKGEVCHKATIEADSTKKDKDWEILGTLFLSIGFTAISGGPKTPHEVVSGQVAMSKALKPWVDINKPKEDIEKIE